MQRGGQTASAGLSTPGPPADPHRVALRTFGGLQIQVDGAPVEVGPARRRAVLVLLLAARGRVVPAAELVDLLWGEAPADSSLNQLHRLVGEIRRLFEPGLGRRAAGRHLAAAGRGYRLDVAGTDCDLSTFAQLVERARRSAAPHAHPLLREALELAADRPFADAPDQVRTHPLVVALERERVEVAVQLVQTSDPSGLPAVVLGQLRQVAADVPLDEPLQAAVVTALAAAGQRAEALQHLERTRRLLVDELGVDPGEELRVALQQALSDAPSPRPRAPEPPGLRPAQLPPRVPAFSERPELTRQLVEQAANGTAGQSVAITALAGMAGVGKTALAVDWAHRIAHHYPDGQLYLNLRGFDPTSPALLPEEALAVLLESLGVVGSPAQDSVDARSALFRSAVAGRRLLIVLDNARSTEQVEPLLPGTAGCRVIVTSRHQLVGLLTRHQATSVQLDRLDDVGSRDLLVRRLGAGRVAAEPAAVAHLVSVCAGLPLALAIVAARAHLQSQEPLATLAAELQQPAPRVLDALATGEVADDVRLTFSWSYRALSDDAARAFRLSAAHPGAEIPLAALSTTTGFPLPRVRQLVAELAAASMVTRTSPDRFTLHDLLRAYATEILDQQGGRADAENRLITHYRHGVRAAYAVYGRQPLNLLEPDERVTTPEIPDIAAALEWYVLERSALYSIVNLAYTHDRGRDGVMIVLDARPMSMDRDLPSDLIPHVRRALEVSEGLDDQLLLAEVLRALGDMLWSGPEGTQLVERAGELFAAGGDLAGQANVLRNLGSIHVRFGDLQAAINHYEQGVEVAVAAGRRDLQAVTTSDLASALDDAGRHHEAIAAYQQAEDIATATGLHYLQPSIAAGQAVIWANLRDWPRCAATARHALQQLQISDPLFSMVIAACLARAAWELGDLEEARTAAAQFRQVREIATDDYIEQYVGQPHQPSEVSVARTEHLLEHHVLTPVATCRDCPLSGH